MRPHHLALPLLLAACADYRLEVTGDGSVPLGGGTQGTGGGGQGGGTGTGGGEAFDGGTWDPTFMACTNLGRQVLLAPLDLFILLDVSGSMDYDFKWPSVKSALESFITRPQFSDLGVGIQYFPLLAQCRPDAYAAPSVPIGVLQSVDGGVSNAERILNSLEAQRMSGGTPTVPALEGALAYTRAYLQQPANAGRKAAVVLATDGVPDLSCSGPEAPDGGQLSNTLDNVGRVVLAGATGTPQVRTFVIGVGSELVALDQIAFFGGTTRAVLVNVAANADVQFLNALTQIRRDALGCDFPVPFQQTIDLTRGRVGFFPTSGGAPLVMPPRADHAACQGQHGWYFDDPLFPSKVVLCEASCDLVTQQGRTGDLRVEFPCGVN